MVIMSFHCQIRQERNGKKGMAHTDEWKIRKEWHRQMNEDQRFEKLMKVCYHTFYIADESAFRLEEITKLRETGRVSSFDAPSEFIFRGDYSAWIRRNPRSGRLWRSPLCSWDWRLKSQRELQTYLLSGMKFRIIYTTEDMRKWTFLSLSFPKHIRSNQRNELCIYGFT